MEISSVYPHYRLYFFLLAPVACAGDTAGLGSGATESSSTGESPATPTSEGPAGSSSGTDAGSSTSTADATTGATDFADPGPVCGDGVVDLDEQCDDGTANDPYAPCTDACQLNVCGDGFVLVGTESCDEGVLNKDTGYCTSECRLGVCGDGLVFAGVEECDAGAAASGVYGECDASCTINRCGDGTVDPGFEECDAGANNGMEPRGEVSMAGCDLECGLAGRRLFLSSQLFNGDLGTRAGADLACQNMAEAAKFKHPERYRALLADAEVDPFDFVIEDAAGRPFILPSGLIVAANFATLMQDGPGDGITMTETGETLHDWWVWTNLNVAGTAYQKDPTSTCMNWTSDSLADSARVGRSSPPPGEAMALAAWKAGKQWLSHQTPSCKLPYRLYCIEAL